MKKKNISILIAIGKGGFYHAGQVCVSVQRVFVHESIVDEVATRLADYASKLVVGDQLDPKTEVGPLINNNEVNRVEEWVNEAVTKGGEDASTNPWTVDYGKVTPLLVNAIQDQQADGGQC